MRESATSLVKRPTLAVVHGHVGREVDCNRTARGCGSGCQGQDGTGHQRADRANGEDNGSEDVSPNAHDCLHAFAEVTAQTLVRRP